MSSQGMSNSLGFTLDETEVMQKGIFMVQSVEAGSASAQAGLRQGDKITRINGKPTTGMGFAEFSHEIAVAQQQQLKNNMIHLMVMRKSAKTAPAADNASPEPGKLKTSSVLTDEGYVPDSLTSSLTTNANASTPASLNLTPSLLSLIKVTPGKLPSRIHPSSP